jgi:hypothetical protein
MSLQLFFFKPVAKFLGMGWNCSWTSQRDSYPAITYRCPMCGKEDAWVAGISGFKGIAPVPKCCANAIPFPTDDESCTAHLNAKPKFSDGKTPSQRIIDTDELGGASGETGYVRGNPAVWR